MNAPLVIEGFKPVRLGQTAAWLLAALLLGCVTALAGLPVLYGVLALAVVVVFAALATRFPSSVLPASIWALALCPFSAGIETGVLPKLFADEMLLLLYLLVLAPMYWVTKRAWAPGAGRYLWMLAALVLCQSVSSLAGTDLIAFRNLLETMVLGPLLFVVFFQETANSDSAETLARALSWLSIVIAILSVVEKLAQRNPLLETLEVSSGFQYLSPRIVAITEGTYRPYVTFFHPSETATFMAMGLPYAVRHWKRERTWFAVLQVLLIAAGMGVNATRGVWVATAVALLLLAKNPLKLLLSTAPVAAVGGGLLYVVLRSTAFMQRATDANNFLGRQ